MPTFRYRAARVDGTTFEGQIESDSEGAARALLEGQGFLVFQLRQKGTWGALGTLGGRSKGKLAPQDFLIFNQELLALVRAGLPVLKVWDLLIEHARQPGFRAVLEKVRQDIRGGASASEALSRHPSCFPALYIASIRAGEQAGNLAEVLQRYIVHLKQMIDLRQKMTKALAYPAFLFIFSMVVTAFLMLFVVPTFIEVYQGTEASLPMATQVLITVVQAVQEYFLFTVGLVLVFGLTVRLWSRTSPGRVMWDRLFVQTPWLGDLLIRQHTIQFTRTLGTVLSGGTTVVDALQICRGAVWNKYLAEGLAGAEAQVRQGGALAASLGQRKVLPRLALEMLSVGEETGSLETMLRDVAEFYENEMEFRLGQLTTWVEIVMLLVMGLVVGTIVVVMYLPIFQMAGSV